VIALILAMMNKMIINDKIVIIDNIRNNGGAIAIIILQRSYISWAKFMYRNKMFRESDI